MANKVFLELIQERLSSLTRAEKKIADYVLEHHEEVVELSVQELAEKAGSSDASIIRFCRTLGTKGYQDFKLRLAREMVSPERRVNPNLEKDDTALSIAEKVFTGSIIALRETLEQLDKERLTAVGEHMHRAAHIYILTSGNSAVVGEDLAIKLLKLGKVALHLRDFDQQLMAMSNLHQNDLVFLISHTGSTSTLADAGKIAAERGAVIVLLTAAIKTPLAKVSTYVLPVRGKEAVFHSESTSARLAEIALIDTLLAVMAKVDIRAYGRRIDRARRATARNKF